MISVNITHGGDGSNQYLIFNVKDSITLRLTHRIIGAYSGTYHIVPNQNRHFALPLELMACQVSWLLERGLIRLHPMNYDAALVKGLSEIEAEDVLTMLIEEELHKADIRREKMDAARSFLREKFLVKNLEKSSGGGGSGGEGEKVKKKRGGKKSGDSLYVQDNMDDAAKQGSKYARMPGVGGGKDEETLNQTFVEPVIGTKHAVPVLAKAYKFVNEDDYLEGVDSMIQELMRMELRPDDDGGILVSKLRVFEHLQQRGCYLTSGLKFGGDFLVYPGDPLLFHATYVAVVILKNKVLSPYDMIGYARMGRNAKKKILLCQWDGSRVQEIVVNWTGWK